MKVFIVYDSKYGNTKLVAENIMQALIDKGIETQIGYAKEVEPRNLLCYDALIIGAPNHMGKPSRTITKFIDSLAEIQLNAKVAAAFDTYFQRERNLGKAMRKLEKHITQRLPNLALVTPGLSIRVKGVNGPIIEGELPKAKGFGRKLAEHLKDTVKDTAKD
jgi:menaquinone-dependent protoporphyrinogen IX oxidase